MTLAEELLMAAPPVRRIVARRVELEDPPLHLLFNGQLSPDEHRMIHQRAVAPNFSWEEA